MRKSSKTAVALAAALAMTAASAMTSWAGNWIYDGPESWQWWYQEEDGTWPANTWKEIDGYWYHFDDNGYLDVGNQKIDGKYYTLLKEPAADVGKMVTSGTWDYGYIGEDGSYVCYEPRQAYNAFYGYGDVYLNTPEGNTLAPEWYTAIFNGVADQSMSVWINDGWQKQKAANTYELPENWQEICPVPFIDALVKYACGSHKPYTLYTDPLYMLGTWYEFNISEEDHTLTVTTWPDGWSD